MVVFKKYLEDSRSLGSLKNDWFCKVSRRFKKYREFVRMVVFKKYLGDSRSLRSLKKWLFSRSIWKIQEV